MAAGAVAVLPATEAGAAQRTLGDRHLAQGDRGRDVRVLQDFLTRVGLSTPVDGHYGPYTMRRVRSWENKTAEVGTDGRFTKRDARILRSQVDRGLKVHQTQQRPAAPLEMTEGPKAKIGPDGKAIAPEGAPDVVKRVIAAANEIHSKPYRYGGGHGSFPKDSGYDCSGSMSYALYGGGLLKTPMDSTGFMSWGDAGPGEWITTYAHGGHAYMVVAGLRFDTSGRADRNSRWTTEERSPKGFTVRHPRGL